DRAAHSPGELLCAERDRWPVARRTVPTGQSKFDAPLVLQPQLFFTGDTPYPTRLYARGRRTPAGPGGAVPPADPLFHWGRRNGVSNSCGCRTTLAPPATVRDGPGLHTPTKPPTSPRTHQCRRTCQLVGN